MDKEAKPIEYIFPPEYYSSELDDIWALVADYAGYATYGEKLGDLANDIKSKWSMSGTLPTDKALLQACLFFESRRSRFVWGYPDETDMPYLRALRDKGFPPK